MLVFKINLHKITPLFIIIDSTDQNLPPFHLHNINGKNVKFMTLRSEILQIYHEKGLNSCNLKIHLNKKVKWFFSTLFNK